MVKKEIFGLKKNFPPKQLCVYEKKIEFKQNFWSEKNVWPEKDFREKKNSWTKNIMGPKIVCVQYNFVFKIIWATLILGPKNWGPKNLGPRKFWVPNKCYAPKKI